EASLLKTESLLAVWDIFDSPYIAVAAAPGAVGLLMTDLTESLLPDVREPLTDAQERTLLGALARLHARFWDFAPPGSWLMRPAQYFDLLPSSIATSPTSLASLTPQLRDAVPRGWGVALARLPPDAGRLMTMPGPELERHWPELPRTLLHGDVKVANFALPGDGRVSAFDWALVGAGPCTIDVGWYIAVNASRLTASKEDTLRRYRVLLESALGRPLADSLWQRLEEVAIVAGARMLLWSKALAADAQRPGADEEWRWWSD